MHETTALYFARGIELSILSADEAREWARSLVDEDVPGYEEVVDSALALSAGELVVTLREAASGADLERVARWLVNAVDERFRRGEISGHDAALLAHSACAACGFYEASDRFDGVCDGFSLTETGAYGTSVERTADLEQALSSYKEVRSRA